MKNYLTPIAIVIAGALIAGAVIYTDFNKSSDTANNPYDFKALDKVTKNDHLRGDLKASITIVEYSDLECPFCKKFHETLNLLRKDYSSDEFAWVFRHAPLDSLHRQARTEAIASECVAKLKGEEAFWTYIDKIYAITTSNDGLDLALLPQFAKEVGVDEQKFKTCLDSKETEKVVQADLDNALEISKGQLGTPFVLVLIDGKDEPLVLPGAVPYEQLKPAIDQLLADSKDN